MTDHPTPTATRALVPLALLWLVFGFRLIEHPDPYPPVDLWLETWPLWLRVAVWWVAAGVALVVRVVRPLHPRWGYYALGVPIALRVGSYAVATAQYPDYIDNVAFYALVTWLLIVLSEGTARRRGRPPR